MWNTEIQIQALKEIQIHWNTGACDAPLCEWVFSNASMGSGWRGECLGLINVIVIIIINIIIINIIIIIIIINLIIFSDDWDDCRPLLPPSSSHPFHSPFHPLLYRPYMARTPFTIPGTDFHLDEDILFCICFIVCWPVSSCWNISKYASPSSDSRT